MKIRFLGQIIASQSRPTGCSACGNSGLGRSGVKRVNRKTYLTSSMSEYTVKTGEIIDIPQSDALELLKLNYRVGGHLYNPFEVV